MRSDMRAPRTALTRRGQVRSTGRTPTVPGASSWGRLRHEMTLEQQPVEPPSAQLEAAPRMAELDEAVAPQHAHRARVLGSRHRLDAPQSMAAEGLLQAQRHRPGRDAAAAVVLADAVA